MSENMFEQHSEGIARIMQNPDLGLIAWETTRNCNLKCIHCCLPKNEWKLEKELTTSDNGSIIQFGHDCPVHYHAEFVDKKTGKIEVPKKLKKVKND